MRIYLYVKNIEKRKQNENTRKCDNDEKKLN